MNKELAKTEINSLYNHLSETNKMALDIVLEASDEVEKLKEALLLLYKSDEGRTLVDNIACRNCEKRDYECDICDMPDDKAVEIFINNYRKENEN